ncbi:unnamed protein product [Bursaphelenchus okinawaensis]|uniref:Uncharacterized protein n=1 Tax=Bursaphelenchus okinawaensis TaxID=465554 RepID=A0A811JWD9_9BILA|nr:unnamed protein product [Bursaphelenchus okinawaensis]CAG9086124.1 unnamed protein product [Bursaphelenchus okinawaensis]
MDFLNPFSDSEQFSVALILLFALLMVIGLLSMYIAYRYYYRYRIGRHTKDPILTMEEGELRDEEALVDNKCTTAPPLDEAPYQPIVLKA